jgi:DNA repair exonuclease SbcCD ATPase subunit
MSESIKINSLAIENVKRVKAVELQPSPSGLTIVGGKNRQGKTSVLDAIAWALGGNKFKPSEPQREGSVLPPALHIKLSNGLIVERKGKNSDLKVTDPSGGRSGQALLDSFVEELAINLPKFMQSTSKEKAQTLLQIIGVGDQLFELEQQEIELYNERRAIGQIADQKAKFAKEQESYPDAPEELVSASELIKEQQEILARNGENQRKRDHLEKMQREEKATDKEIVKLRDEMNRLEQEIFKAEAAKNALAVDIQMAMKTVSELQDESTAELEKSLEDIEEINVQVRANLDKKKAEEEAKKYKDQYDELTVSIENIRKEKMDLLDGANLPLEGLSVEEGELTYQGFRWDNLSGSDQLKIATAIVRKLNPQCGFVLLDKLEQMDLDTLRDFGKWLEGEGLQAIATRVSTGEECQIIIEDGYGIAPEPAPRKYEKGVF